MRNKGASLHSGYIDVWWRLLTSHQPWISTIKQGFKPVLFFIKRLGLIIPTLLLSCLIPSSFFGLQGVAPGSDHRLLMLTPQLLAINCQIQYVGMKKASYWHLWECFWSRPSGVPTNGALTQFITVNQSLFPFCLDVVSTYCWENIYIIVFIKFIHWLSLCLIPW